MIDEDAIRYRWETVGSQAGRARAAAVRGGRGADRRAGAVWRWSRGSPGSPARRSIAARTISTRRRCAKGRVRRDGGGRKAVERERSGAGPRPQAPGRAGDAGRSHAAADRGCRRAWTSWRATLTRDGPSDQRRHGAQGAGEARLLAPVQPQGRRRLEASRPQRAVRAHQRESRCGAGRRPAGHLGRHQEEGAGRQLQERRLRLSPEGRSACA